MAERLFSVEAGSLIFGTSKMVPDPRAGFTAKPDGSFARHLKVVEAELVISADGKTASLRSAPGVQSGGALTRAMTAAQRPQPTDEPVVTVPILQVSRGGELTPVRGAGWLLGPDGWVMPFHGQAGVDLEFVVPAGSDWRERQTLWVRPYQTWDTAFLKVLFPRAATPVCPKPKCGAPVSPGAKFCRKCGTKL